MAMQISVVRDDILSFPCDVLPLKHLTANRGANYWIRAKARLDY